MFNWKNQQLNELHQRQLRTRAQQMRLAQELRDNRSASPSHDLREQQQAERIVILALSPA